MRQPFYILTFTLALTACSQNGSTSNDQKTDSLAMKVNADTLPTNKEKTHSERLGFNNVREVVQDRKSNAWVELKDSSASLALHFNLSYNDTLTVSYSPECCLMYPFKTEKDKIIIYWDNFIDSKYDFDIVKAINKIDKKYLGKPFMILELVNDTTLKATYPIPELIRKINSSSKERTFFPEKFIVSQEFYL